MDYQMVGKFFKGLAAAGGLLINLYIN